jgi:hypothetical protein
MDCLKYQKKDLIEIITKNRDAHYGFFEKACIAYKDAVIDELERSLIVAKTGRKIQAFIRFVEPVEHVKDYDRVLKMLELATDKVIELDESDFAMYVMDDWAWKQQFIASNSTYMAGVK